MSQTKHKTDKNSGSKEILVVFQIKSHVFIWFQYYFCLKNISWKHLGGTSEYLYLGFILDTDNLSKSQTYSVIFQNQDLLVFSLIAGSSTYNRDLSLYVRVKGEWVEFYRSLSNQDDQRATLLVQSDIRGQQIWIIELLDKLGGAWSNLAYDSLSASMTALFSNNMQSNFIWSWWSIEWLINQIGEANLLNYPYNKTGEKARNKFKKELNELIHNFIENADINPSNLDEFNFDKKYLINKFRSDLFYPSLKQNLFSMKAIFDELKDKQTYLYSFFSEESRKVLSYFLNLTYQEVENLISDEIRNYRNNITHDGLKNLIINNNKKNQNVRKFPSNARLFLLNLFSFVKLEDLTDEYFRYKSKFVEEELFETINKYKTYYLEFFENSDFILNFQTLEINSGKITDQNVILIFEKAEYNTLHFKNTTNFFERYPNIVYEKGTSTKFPHTGLTIMNQTYTLRIINNDKEHIARVVKLGISNDIVRLRILSIYQKEIFEKFIGGQ